jgi:hypothetical protein
LCKPKERTRESPMVDLIEMFGLDADSTIFSGPPGLPLRARTGRAGAWRFIC